MKQISLVQAESRAKKRETRRERFLFDMERPPLAGRAGRNRTALPEGESGPAGGGCGTDAADPSAVASVPHRQEPHRLSQATRPGAGEEYRPTASPLSARERGHRQVTASCASSPRCAQRKAKALPKAGEHLTEASLPRKSMRAGRFLGPPQSPLPLMGRPPYLVKYIDQRFS